MAASLGNPEKAALIALMLVGEEVSTPDLKKRHGIDLRKETREKLNKENLITSYTDTRPHTHKITDAGVTKCEEVLVSMELPPRAPVLLSVIFDVLRPFVRYFQQHNIRLTDVLRTTDTETATTLESLIRKAYDELKVKPQDWVRLARLRPRLNGAGKDEVDKVLLAMTRTGLVHLAPDSDRKTLTDADRTAAIRIGKEDKHLVAIEES
jgi:hypothetical protein